MLGKSRLNYQELSTIIIEVKGIINTPPLTYLYHDDDITTITPSHLIVRRNLLENMSNSNIDDFDMTTDKCTRCYEYLKTTIEQFWNRFSQEYITNLRKRQTYNRIKYDSFNKLIVDDKVIIKDNGKLTRLQWKKGVLQELITDRDNNVRGVVVRVTGNEGKIITLERDCKYLIPLELVKNITENDSSRRAAVNLDIIQKTMV